MIESATALLSPPTAIAGEVGTWTLTYRVGSGGLVAGDRLVIDTDSDTDWEEPQTRNPAGTGYTEIRLPEGGGREKALAAALTVETVKKMHLSLLSGALKEGEELSLIFGAGPGLRMQTFAEERRYFHVTVVGAGGERRRLEGSPSLRILGGPAVRLILIGPTTVSPGTPVRMVVKAEDRWGNPASGFADEVTVRLADEEQALRLPVDRAVAWVEFSASSLEDTSVIRAVASAGRLRAEGNPMTVSADSGYRRLWGDFHGGQLVDPEKIAAYYAYARDVSGLSFVSNQRNDHEMTDPEWELQKKTELDFYHPGEFIALPGYEWSADTHLGGDRIVLFPRHGLPLLRSSYSAVEGEEPDPARELPNQKALYDHYRFTNVVLLPHVGGRQSDIELHDPQLEHVVEIASTHGTFEWFYLDALRRGYKVGVVAGSDGYTGRPGSEFPGHIARRFSRSGSAAILAEEFSLTGILDALRARRTYGTSGPRIYLDLRAEGPGIEGAAGLGEEVRATGPVRLTATVAGTAEIDRVDVFRRDTLIHTEVPEGRYEGRWRVLMRGSSAWKCYTGVRWLGRLSLTGAPVSELEPLRFDSPRSTAQAADSEVEWDTTNCGYSHGFEFSLGPEGASGASSRGGAGIPFELSVESHLYSPMYSGAELPGTMRISRAPAERTHFVGVLPNGTAGPGSFGADLGPADRKVLLEPILEGRPRELSFIFTDPDIAPGVNPYWIRVTQRDMHNAWSSPVFVSYQS
jgi:hypothetical protein